MPCRGCGWRWRQRSVTDGGHPHAPSPPSTGAAVGVTDIVVVIVGRTAAGGDSRQAASIAVALTAEQEGPLVAASVHGGQGEEQQGDEEAEQEADAVDASEDGRG